MSVDVKTPTKTQLERQEFPCGKRKLVQPVAGCDRLGDDRGTYDETSTNKNTKSPNRFAQGKPQDSAQYPPRQTRKRKFSEKGGGGNVGQQQFNKKKFQFGRHPGKEKIVPPTKFLLGGSITDPLNLNSLGDEQINQILNANTPVSSPLPAPLYRQEVKVLIPPNINDPLNLNSGEDININLISPISGSKKKRKHKHKKRSGVIEESIGDGIEQMESGDTSEIEKEDKICKPLQIKIKSNLQSDSEDIDTKVQNVMDKILKPADEIVSPVIPQLSPKSKKQRREGNDSRLEQNSNITVLPDIKEEPASEKVVKVSPYKPKYKKQTSQGQLPKFRSKDDRFVYGNYDRYYGYRNPAMEEDHRIKCFQREWFDGKDSLDIGCNVGHITLTVARDFCPKKIVGIDIDAKLIGIAKKNIRHYLSSGVSRSKNYPLSLPVTHGPIVAPPLNTDEKPSTFPNNVHFLQGNYVLDSDELLELQKEEYDVILALSLTKWIHLNFGDDGLKRMFRRIFRQLRPGGKLILEPQAWASYKKKKKLTENIFKNFQKIRFRPERFRDYLLSSQVGFTTCELADMPQNKSKGFQRPILVFTKAESLPVFGMIPRGVTPLMEIDCTPNLTPHTDLPSHGGTPDVMTYLPTPDSLRHMTPRFEIGSTGNTPTSFRNTPVHDCWQGNITPRMFCISMQQDYPGSAHNSPRDWHVCEPQRFMGSPLSHYATQIDKPATDSAASFKSKLFSSKYEQHGCNIERQPASNLAKATDSEPSQMEDTTGVVEAAEVVVETTEAAVETAETVEGTLESAAETAEAAVRTTEAAAETTEAAMETAEVVEETTEAAIKTAEDAVKMTRPAEETSTPEESRGDVETTTAAMETTTAIEETASAVKSATAALETSTAENNTLNAVKSTEAEVETTTADSSILSAVERTVTTKETAKSALETTVAVASPADAVNSTETVISVEVTEAAAESTTNVAGSSESVTESTVTIDSVDTESREVISGDVCCSEGNVIENS